MPQRPPIYSFCHPFPGKYKREINSSFKISTKLEEDIALRTKGSILSGVMIIA